MNNIPQYNKDKLADICGKYHITRLSIYGSAIRDDFAADSDIDVLIEFEPGRTPGFFGMYDIEQELTAVFSGRQIDLRTPQDLSKYIRDKILDQAEVQYVQ